MMPYERFHAWKACDDLAVAVYRVSAAFPRHELYGLTSQSRRAAFSAAANIAEGSAKRGPREFRRYLDIAVGSLSGLSYALRLSWRLEYLSTEQWRELDKLRSDASRLTWLLYRAIGRASQGSDHPSALTAALPTAASSTALTAAVAV
ncbi:MAG: four helix bundle protein [Gemmatimonadales bacterium]